jgi:lysyl-tRNA synthetase class 2
MGEVTLAVAEWRMLAKSLLPLPEKWHGLKDVETRSRQRYLDLLANAEVRERFRRRSQVVTHMRRFLDERGFLEVETPVLQPIYGGGAAQPFTTFYNALDQEMYLRIADELYLKRLVAGGFERVYEVCKDFRNEGIDRTHLPEFTQMECYWAYADYRDLMALVEDMVAEIAVALNGSTRIAFEDRELDLAPPWRRLTVREAIRSATGLDIEDYPEQAALEAAIRSRGLAADPQPTWARTVDELLSEHVEPGLWAPTFLLDYPVALSPLAKRSPEDSRYVERFEPFIAGMEIGNAFTELNDPLDQEERFLEMGRAKDAGDEDAAPLDEDFLEAMRHGMPPMGGLGIGVDRLVMVLTGQTNIREVVLFPPMRARARPHPPPPHRMGHE